MQKFVFFGSFRVGVVVVFIVFQFLCLCIVFLVLYGDFVQGLSGEVGGFYFLLWLDVYFGFFIELIIWIVEIVVFGVQVWRCVEFVFLLASMGVFLIWFVFSQGVRQYGDVYDDLGLLSEYFVVRYLGEKIFVYNWSVQLCIYYFLFFFECFVRVVGDEVSSIVRVD